MPMLYLTCKQCRTPFPSGLDMKLSSATLKGNRHTCGHCGNASVYEQEDYSEGPPRPRPDRSLN